MIDVLKKLEPYFDIGSVKEQYPDIQDDLELSVLILRTNHCSYGQIQS